jgi:hypothetical protein
LPAAGLDFGFCPTGEPIITMYPIDCQLRRPVKSAAGEIHLNSNIQLILLNFIPKPSGGIFPAATIGQTLCPLLPLLHFSHIVHVFYSHPNMRHPAPAPIANT